MIQDTVTEGQPYYGQHGTVDQQEKVFTFYGPVMRHAETNCHCRQRQQHIVHHAICPGYAITDTKPAYQQIGLYYCEYIGCAY